MVRRRDIFRGSGSELLDEKPEKLERYIEKVTEEIKTRSSIPLSEVMIPIKQTAHHDEYVIDAIHKMVDNEVGILPVMKDDKVVGVVRSV